MKRMLCLICAAALLSVTGCGASETQDSTAVTTTTSMTEAAAETTAADETTPLVVTDTPLDTSTAEETVDAESSGSDTETNIIAAIPGDAAPDVSICGRWSYGGSYEMVFHEDFTVTLCTDFSEVMYIEDGVLTMYDVRIPLSVTDGKVCAMKGEETVLSMIPQDGADTDSLTGRFLLEPCSVLNTVGNPNSGARYYIHLTGAKFLVETPAEYRVDQENQVLYMINAAGSMPLHYSLNGDTLRISDSEGNVDEMTRIE